MSDMTYRPLGSSGLLVSTVGLGCNNFGRRLDLDGTRTVVDAALDAGITLLDTADVYGESETLLGEVLKGRRDDVVLATKFGMEIPDLEPSWGARGSRRYVRRAVERSLRRLQTDWIDLYQYHRPDGVTPLAETLEALTELVREGKVRYVGVSNVSSWMVAELAWQSRTRGLAPVVSVQNHYSLLNREVERAVVPACEEYGAGVLPYFPLASGLLTGKYRRGEPLPEGTRISENPSRWADQMTDQLWDALEKLEAFAGERDLSLLDVAIGALAAQPAVGSVIAGATKAEQVRANAGAARWSPTPEDLAGLDEILPSGSVLA